MKRRPASLARWAADESRSRGRRYPEPTHPYRGEYQRDRDRIIHSSAFRRLVYKTQVFINHEGDLYRTRMTHSLEVAQIGRTVARVLRLNSELTEAVSLAHDLGHTPFGHAGQDALNTCMKPWGGFEHNLQSLRVVDELEQRYLAFPGLNLCFETREGILKHCSKRDARQVGELGLRFIERRQPGLEAQVANLADEIAYNNHDVDDGLRSGLLSEESLCAVPLFRRHYEAVRRRGPAASRRVIIHETIRAMINEVVTDLVRTSQRNIEARGPASSDDVRALAQPLIGFGAAIGADHLQLKRYLRRHLYHHPQVIDLTSRAQDMLKAVFERLLADLAELPPEHAARARNQEAEHGTAGRARAVADYVAGMTDRFAYGSYQRLVDRRAKVP